MCFIRLQNDFVSKMKKTFTAKRLNLPLIKHQKATTSGLTVQTQECEAQQVSCLDQWTTQNEQPISKRSKIIKALYRQSIGRRMKKREMTESSLIIEAKLFLMRMEGELRKAQDINYDAIYKNIQFCSGIYENTYGCLVREIDKLKEALFGRYEHLEETLKDERMHHIQSMERLDQKQNYRNQIPKVRKIIEDKEAELEPIKNTIQNLDDARRNVLKRCLAQGYDVREEGLLWIMRQLKGEIVRQDFPKFLNEKEVEYLFDKYKIQLAAAEKYQKSTLMTMAPEKTQAEIIDIITRKKHRDFTMVHDSNILAELQKKQAMKLNSQRHHLISSEVLRMAKQQLTLTKATKYELIYKETIRKLNKFCSDQIHNKQRNVYVPQAKRNSTTTLKLISCFDAKIEDYLKESMHSSSPKNQQNQENALDEILRCLRYEGYQLGQKSGRNPISVVACLVGWKKAKKLVDNDLNSVL